MSCYEIGPIRALICFSVLLYSSKKSANNVLQLLNLFICSITCYIEGIIQH